VHDAASSAAAGDRDERLAERLSAVARSLQRADDVEQTLEAIVRSAVETVPGAQHASVSSVLGRRAVHTRATTDDLARAVDAAQHETGEGPCFDALYETRTVWLRDLSKEERWPTFVRRARELGVGSMLSVQLFVDGDDLGVLCLLSKHPGAFDDESESVALLFAAHAAVAMSGAEQVERVQRALSTREVIGQAQGVLMERFKITSDQAFSRLVRASQATNRKLHAVAQDLVESGDLPET
jgi:GAF domain-containing protein